MSDSALLVVDMLTTYDHAGGDELADCAEKALPKMQRLLERARESGLPTIYVNDNLGDWRSDREQIVAKARQGRRPDLIEPILPHDEAMFVVKARHSVFYQTALEYLLSQAGIERVVLMGQVTEQCILYSALDAHLRHIDVTVVSDAVAHIHPHLAEASLELMKLNMAAEITSAEDCPL